MSTPIGQTRQRSSERRQDPRIEYEKKIYFKSLRSQNHGGLIRDVSENGAFFVTHEVFPPKSDLVLYLPLDFHRKKKLCMIPCEVVRVEGSTGTILRGHGVRFKEKLPPTTRLLIQDFLTYKITGVHPDRTVPGATITNPGHAAQDSLKSVPETTTPSNPAYEHKKFEIPKKKRTSKAQANIRARQVTNTRFKKASALNKGIWIGSIVLFLLVSSYLVFGFVQKELWYSRLSGIVPMVEIKIDGKTLRAKVSSDWLKSSQQETRRSAFNSLAHALQDKRLEGAVLIDPEGKEVASIERDVSNDGDLVVRLTN